MYKRKVANNIRHYNSLLKKLFLIIDSLLIVHRQLSNLLLTQKKQYPQQGGYLVVGIACVSVFNILILKKGDRY